MRLTFEQRVIFADDARVVVDKPPGVEADALATAFDRPLQTPLESDASGLVVLGDAPPEGLGRSVWHLATVGDGKLGAIVARQGRRRWCRVADDDIRRRANLAGAPIVGAPEGAPHHRLMLHREGFEGFPHRVEPAWPGWIEERPYVETVSRVAEAAYRRWLHFDGGDMVRLVHGAGDGLPGVEIDRYGDWAVASLRDEVVDHEEAVLDALGPLGFRGIYVKRRPREAKGLVDTRRDEVAPREAVRGDDAPEPLVLFEGSRPYEVRLGDGLSTGIFLDQRDARAWLADHAEGTRVLNLFCYHAAFTVAAVCGGAIETVSVDTASPALGRAEEALRRAGVEPSATHALVRDDAMRYLQRAAKQERRFDRIIVDPPSFASTKKGRKTTTWRVVRDYPELLARSLAVLAPNGVILACTNHRATPASRFRQWLEAGAEQAGQRVAIEPLPPPVDYPPPPGEPPHLKRCFVRLTGPS